MKMKIVVILGLLTLIIFPNFVIAECIPCTDSNRESLSLCGPNCLQYIFQKNHIKSNINELIKLSGKTEAGTTLAGLYRAITEKGMYAIGAKISLEEIRYAGATAIIHLWDNHFVVIETGIDDKTFYLTDPPNKTVLTQNEDIKSNYSGFALLVSKKPINLPKDTVPVADIRLSTYSLDLGTADEKVILSSTVVITNKGEAVLKLDNIRPNCPCVSVSAENNTLEPGESCNLNIQYDTTGLSGYQSKNIFISSNDPITQISKLTIGCFVYPNEIFGSAKLIDFGKIYKNDITKKSIFFKDPGKNNLQLSVPLIKHPYLKADIINKMNEINSGYLINVETKQGIPIGKFESKMVIYMNYFKNKRIEIPITGEVIGDIEYYPSSLFFGFLNKGVSLTKTVNIMSNNSTLKITGIDNPYSFIEVKAEQTKVKGKINIIGIFKADAPVGYTKGEIIVHTDNPDQPAIKIPVYAYIQDKG